MSERPPIAIRRGRLGDLSTLVDFNARMAQETEGLSLDRERLTHGVRAALEDESKGWYFVAEADGRVVGQLMVTFEWSDWRSGMIWWIQSVYVAPEWRRRGVYRALYEHVHQQACSGKGVAGIRLYVDAHNQIAQTVYANLGMEKSNYLVFERVPL